MLVTVIEDIKVESEKIMMIITKANDAGINSREDAHTYDDKSKGNNATKTSLINQKVLQIQNIIHDITCHGIIGWSGFSYSEDDIEDISFLYEDGGND